jgi:hypothetical protein
MFSLTKAAGVVGGLVSHRSRKSVAERETVNTGRRCQAQEANEGPKWPPMASWEVGLELDRR